MAAERPATPSRRPRMVVAGLLLGLSLLMVAQSAPAPATRLIKADSGVFCYIGQQILQGHLPYRDAWENKPPLVFYLDALGLFLGRGSFWGVWALTLAAFLAAAWLCYAAAERVYGRWPALIGTLCLAAAVVWTIDEGNMTELYGLPLQLAMVYLFVGSPRARDYFVMGVLAGGLFLLRQNLIGMAAAVALATAITGYRSLRAAGIARRFGAMLGGFVVPLGLCAAYFAAKGGLADLYGAAFGFNFEYTAVSWRTRILSLLPGIKAVSDLGVMYLAVAGILFAGVSWLRRQPAQIKPLLLVCLIDLPLEMVLSSISGKGWLHYFMTWAPALALLCAYAAYAIQTFSSSEEIAVWRSRSVTPRAAFLAIAGLLIGAGLVRASAQKLTWRPDDTPRRVVAAYAGSHTAAGDRIFVWGFSPDIYLMSGRAAPDRFFHQYPLVQRQFADRAIISELVAALERARPRVIVDTAYASAANEYPPLDRAGREAWARAHRRRLGEMEPLFALMDKNYQPVAVSGGGRLAVYVPR